MDNYQQLPDFITLYTTDANNTANRSAGDPYIFNVPDSYYSPDRSSTCYLSLCMCAGDFDATSMGLGATDESVFLVYSNGASNYASSKNTGIVLGTLTLNSVTNCVPLQQSALLQPLIASKPNTMSFQFQNAGGTPLKETNRFRGIITLRFDYINAYSQARGLFNTFQPNLL